MITAAPMAMAIAANHEKPAKSAPKSAMRPNRQAPISHGSCIPTIPHWEHCNAEEEHKFDGIEVNLNRHQAGIAATSARHGQALWWQAYVRRYWRRHDADMATER